MRHGSTGTFPELESVSMERGCHEGLSYKFADENMVLACRARGRDCLPGGSNCGVGGDPCGRAGSPTHGVERDLRVDSKIDPTPKNQSYADEVFCPGLSYVSCKPQANPLKYCGASIQLPLQKTPIDPGLTSDKPTPNALPTSCGWRKPCAAPNGRLRQEKCQ